MRKLFFAVCIALLVASCNNDNMNDENPYPDGVYPFEVSGVSHTRDWDNYNTSVTWTNPTDGGFSKVTIELVVPSGDDKELNLYPIPDPNYPVGVDYHDFTLNKNSLSFFCPVGGHIYAIIKCVDKFDNVSQGVKYEFSW